MPETGNGKVLSECSGRQFGAEDFLPVRIMIQGIDTYCFVHASMMLQIGDAVSLKTELPELQSL
jgi:hypothetical protein